MPIKILMPALSPTMEEGTLAKWVKNEGDTVSAGDVIAEIETDKATMEVEAVDEGTLGKILIEAGTENVKVNTPIALLLEEGEDAADLDKAASSPAPAPEQKSEASETAEPEKPASAPATPAAEAKPEPDAPEGTAMVQSTVREALRDAMAEEMRRDGDVFLPLNDRIAFAEEMDADLFISIHADAAPTPDARGLSAYTLSERASDGLADALASAENRVDRLYGVDLSHTDAAVAMILQDLAHRYSHHASRTAKQKLVSGLVGQIDLLYNPMRSASFAVLKSAQVPAVLLETGFLSNPQDERLLAQTESRRRIAAILGNRIATVAGELRIQSGA